MNTKNPRLFYGYVVLASAVIIMMVALGANRTYGVFLDPMLTEFGWTRASISGAYTLAMILMGTMAIATVRMTDRFGPRVVLVSCGFLMGLGYMLISQVHVIWQLYLFYGMMTGVGLSGIIAPLMSVVARWFFKRRALMSSILMVGPSLGITVMPLVFSLLIPVYGWRLSYAILGGVVLAIIAPAALFLKRNPESMGLLPYGADKVEMEDLDLQKVGFSPGEAVKTRQFWLLSIIAFCGLFIVNIVIVHIVIHTVEMGFSATTATSVLSIAAGVSIPARIVVGGIADRFGIRKILLIVLVMAVFAFILLLVARELWMLYLFAVLYGVGLWASFGVMSPLVADLFGLKSHGTIFAFIMLATTAGGAVGPVLAGYIFDITGSYQFAFIACIGIILTSLMAVTCLRPITNRSEKYIMQGDLKWRKE